MVDYVLFESNVDASKLSTELIKESILNIEVKINELLRRRMVLIQELLRREEGKRTLGE